MDSKQFLRTHLALLLLACFLFVASTSASAAVKDACTVISAADAQAALGEPVGPGKPEGASSAAGDGSRCRYKSTIGKGLHVKSVSVSVQYSSTDLTGSIHGISDNLKSAGYTMQDVSGIGNAAVWGTSSFVGRPQGELTVIKGKSVMVIVIIDGLPDFGVALARAKDIAAKTLPQT